MAEAFEVFSPAGRRLGLMPRADVHATGAWHRSSHVFLLDATHCLLVQQRAPSKDLFPGCWDYSVGEHCVPGEPFAAAALRGCIEELGLDELSLEALAPPARAETAGVTAGGVRFIDREIQQAFVGVLPAHTSLARLVAQRQRSEVAALELIPLAQLEDLLEREPSRFAPWFVREYNRFRSVLAAAQVST